MIIVHTCTIIPEGAIELQNNTLLDTVKCPNDKSVILMRRVISMNDTVKTCTEFEVLVSRIDTQILIPFPH